MKLNCNYNWGDKEVVASSISQSALGDVIVVTHYKS